MHMNTRNISIGIALLMMAAAIPAAGYHIDFFDGSGASEPGDWVVQNPFLIICESNGVRDDRNYFVAEHAGVGGLCTTGRNDATGTTEPGSTPDNATWTRLDTCSVPTLSREAQGGATHMIVDDVCWVNGTAVSGDTGFVSWSAEIGVYECYVPNVGSAFDYGLGALATKDYALYYNELYAWWSYDGPGEYTVNDAPGADQNGGADQLTSTTNNTDSYRGHVSMFIDATTAELPVSGGVPDANFLISGSAVTTSFAESSPHMKKVLNPANLTDTGLTANNCGASPSDAPNVAGEPAGFHTGPVIVAPHNPDDDNFTGELLPEATGLPLPTQVIVIENLDGTVGRSFVGTWAGCGGLVDTGTHWTVTCNGPFIVPALNPPSCAVLATVALNADATSSCTDSTGATMDAPTAPVAPGVGVGINEDLVGALTNGGNGYPFVCSVEQASVTGNPFLAVCTVNP